MDSMTVRIIIFGGTGHWAEQNHYPAILKLKARGFDVKVAAICDPINPYTANHDEFHEKRHGLQEVLEADKPLWIDPQQAADAEIQEVLQGAIDVAIISTNPVHHMRYALLALKANLHILCDKPIVVRENSSWQLNQARGIMSDFNQLLDLVSAKRQTSRLLFSIPLRRRNLPAFKEIVSDLSGVYLSSGQHITHLNAVVNGGIHRYPSEFRKGGAHGYLEGVGSLSHSSYHYIDFIAWLISSAPGHATSIGVSVSNIKRVSDYLEQSEYQTLATVNGHDVVKEEDLPESVLNSELDFHVSIKLYANKNVIGQLYLTVNHTTYSPRRINYSMALDHANQTNGGRMSQLFLDIHQGALQNWQLIKNDAVFSGNDITVSKRTHPLLSTPALEVKKHTNAYSEDVHNSISQVASFIESVANEGVVGSASQDIEDQLLTMRLYAAMYESIASSFEGHDNREIKLDIT